MLKTQYRSIQNQEKQERSGKLVEEIKVLLEVLRSNTEEIQSIYREAGDRQSSTGGGGSDG